MFKSDLRLLMTGRLLSAKAYVAIFLLGVLVGALVKAVM